MRYSLPSLLLTLLLSGCGEEPLAPSISNAELEALQEAEALRHDLKELQREQQRVDALLDVYRGSDR